MRRVDVEIRQHVLIKNVRRSPYRLSSLAKRSRVEAHRAVPSKQGVIALAAERRSGSCKMMPAAQLAKPTSLMPMSISRASAGRLKIFVAPTRMAGRGGGGAGAE